jgi:hypothetical protein
MTPLLGHGTFPIEVGFADPLTLFVERTVRSLPVLCGPHEIDARGVIRLSDTVDPSM